MSTRCQIGIYEDAKDIGSDKDIQKKWKVLLYRHSDGYPGSMTKKKDEYTDGVIPDILPFVNAFIGKRGYDCEYLGACLMAYMKYWHCGSKMVEPSKLNVKINGFEIDPLTHGVSNSFHGDIAYFYAITPAFIRVYKVMECDDLKFEQIEEHKLERA